MAEASVKRRGPGEDAIYFAAAKNRYVGAVSLGYTPEGKRIRCGQWLLNWLPADSSACPCPGTAGRFAPN